MTKITRLLSISALLAGSLFASSIEVEDAYAREVPPSVMNSAAFMEIENSSDKDIALVGATSDVSKIVELHTHEMKDGMMQMFKVDKIVVPANGEVALKPGGYHVMFIGLKRALKSGENVEVELMFDNGEKVQITAPVKKVVRKMMPMGHEKMGHGKMHGHE